MSSRSALKATVLASTAAVLLAGCSAAKTEQAAPASTAAPTSVTIQDNTKSHTIALPVKSVVITDNRQFETLASWGVKPAAVPV
ncbi:MAG: iron ABC transporter substrate-binding protein, partial [Propionibacteriaceae bacterium]